MLDDSLELELLELSELLELELLEDSLELLEDESSHSMRM